MQNRDEVKTAGHTNSFSYSLITKSKYGLLKGVLVLVIVN